MAKRNVEARIAALQRQIAEIRVKAAEAAEFRLVDKAGRVRAALEMTRSGPRLMMMHEDGTVALEVALAAQGPSVRLADANGQTRVFVGATRNSARIGLADGTGAQRAFIGVSQGGQPAITTYDAKQRTLWSAPG
jgi:hypothetical protein